MRSYAPRSPRRIPYPVWPIAFPSEIRKRTYCSFEQTETVSIHRSISPRSGELSAFERLSSLPDCHSTVTSGIFFVSFFLCLRITSFQRAQRSRIPRCTNDAVDMRCDTKHESEGDCIQMFHFQCPRWYVLRSFPPLLPIPCTVRCLRKGFWVCSACQTL